MQPYIPQRLEQRLPPNLAPLAPALASALRQPAQKSAEAFLARPQFQQRFVNLSATAHEKIVNVLENKTGNGISTGNGVVTLNLHTFVTELGQEIGLPEAALAKISPASTCYSSSGARHTRSAEAKNSHSAQTAAPSSREYPLLARRAGRPRDRRSSTRSRAKAHSGVR